MLFRRNIIVFFVLLVTTLSLAGCFRQASDPSVEVENANSASSSEQTLPSAPTSDLDAASGSGDVQPTVFIESVTLPAADPTEGSESDTGMTVVPITVIPRFTQPPRATESANTPAQTNVDAAAPQPSATPQFVTPFTMPTVPVQASPTSAQTTLPQAQPGGLITPTAIGDSSDGCSYTVQPGDTFYRIAVGNNLTLEELTAANPQISNPDILSPGDIVLLPGCGQGTTVETQPDSAEQPASGDSNIVGGSGQQVHTVQRGETLFSIAQTYGVTVQQIVDANNLQNPNVLNPGQQLIIPAP